jgi:hypothetical protein
MAQSVEEAIRGLRVIVAGLIAGLLAFAVLAVVVRTSMTPTGSVPPLVLLGLLAVVAVSSAAAYAAQYTKVVRDLSVRATELRQLADPSSAIVGPYRAFAIVGAALIEGPSFFALIVYILTGQPLAMVAAALGVVLLIAHLPSRSAVRRLGERATQ